jgi:CRP/FNR family cyclic AMP-dependent transcriptional regulator
MRSNPAGNSGIPVDRATASWDFFANLPAEREAFYSIGRRRTIQPKEHLFSIGEIIDKVYYIVEGKVILSTISRKGKEIVVYIHKSGGLLGLIGSLASQPRALSATALTACTIYEVRTADFKSLQRKSPVFSERVNLQLYMDLAFITNLYLSALTDDAETRIKKTLARLFSEELLKPQPEGQHDTISTYITQDYLAASVGISRERTNKLLGQLEQEGLISKSAHHITFLKPDHFLSYLEIVPLLILE